jgi:hypothetical protein
MGYSAVAAGAVRRGRSEPVSTTRPRPRLWLRLPAGELGPARGTAGEPGPESQVCTTGEPSEDESDGGGAAGYVSRRPPPPGVGGVACSEPSDGGVVRSVPALAYVCTSGLTTGDADAEEAESAGAGRCIREDGRGGGGIAIGIALGGREGGGSVYAADRRAGAGSGTPSSARRLSTGTPACTTIIVSVCLQGGRGKGADADAVLDELGAEDLVEARGAQGRVLRVGEARAQLLVLAAQRVEQRVGRGRGLGCVGGRLLLRAAERGELAREAVDVRLGLVLERGLEVDLLLPELCG